MQLLVLVYEICFLTIAVSIVLRQQDVCGRELLERVALKISLERVRLSRFLEFNEDSFLTTV